MPATGVAGRGPSVKRSREAARTADAPASARANARKSAVRARVEHVFAQQKAHMGLRVRTIGLPRAQTRIGLANLAYNFQRLIWEPRSTMHGEVLVAGIGRFAPHLQ